MRGLRLREVQVANSLMLNGDGTSSRPRHGLLPFDLGHGHHVGLTRTSFCLRARLWTNALRVALAVSPPLCQATCQFWVAQDRFAQASLPLMFMRSQSAVRHLEVSSPSVFRYTHRDFAGSWQTVSCRALACCFQLGWGLQDGTGLRFRLPGFRIGRWSRLLLGARALLS